MNNGEIIKIIKEDLLNKIETEKKLIDDEIEKEKQEIKIKIEKLIPPSYDDIAKKYSVIERLFKSGTIVKEYQKSCTEIRNKRNEIIKSKHDYSDKFNELDEQILNIKKTNDLKTLLSFFPNAKDYFIDKFGYGVFQYSSYVELFNDSFGDDIEMMKKALKENPDNIIFDKTNDPSLYLEIFKMYFNNLKERDESYLSAYEYDIENVKKMFQDVFNNPNSEIKQAEAFELMRDSLSKRNGTNFMQDIERSSHYYDLVKKMDIDSLNYFRSLSGNGDFYLKEVLSPINGGVNSEVVMREGVILSTKNDYMCGKRFLENSMMKTRSTLLAAGYFYGCGGIGTSNIYVGYIPDEQENRDYFLGQDEENYERPNHFAPDYIIGYTEISDNGERRFIPNNIPLEERKKYNYYFKNGSSWYEKNDYITEISNSNSISR